MEYIVQLDTTIAGVTILFLVVPQSRVNCYMPWARIKQCKKPLIMPKLYFLNNTIELSQKRFDKLKTLL